MEYVIWITNKSVKKLFICISTRGSKLSRWVCRKNWFQLVLEQCNVSRHQMRTVLHTALTILMLLPHLQLVLIAEAILPSSYNKQLDQLDERDPHWIRKKHHAECSVKRKDIHSNKSARTCTDTNTHMHTHNYLSHQVATYGLKLSLTIAPKIILYNPNRHKTRRILETGYVSTW